MLLDAKERHVKGREIKNVMEAHLIPTHIEFNSSDAYNVGGTLAISESHMVVFPHVLAKGDNILSYVAHVVIYVAIHYIFTLAVIARDV